TKYIDVKYHYVRDVISQGKLKLCKISIHNNPADMMTKLVHVGLLKLSWFDSLAQESIWRQNFYSLLCSGDDFDMLQEGICLKVEYIYCDPNSGGRLLKIGLGPLSISVIPN